MLITITPDELEEEFKESWRMGFISHPHIDYATNAIHATFEGKDVIIFKFHKYGWISDNRQNTYSISAGSAGILIKIK
jgi:hypothetical protein